jgi:hypothetical protein
LLQAPRALTVTQQFSFHRKTYLGRPGVDQKKEDAKNNGQQKGSEPFAGPLLLMKDFEADGFTIYE